MIYTVTFNPSLDYIVSVDHFQLGKTNRTRSELMLPGGKGINVSIVLNNLGLPTTALGFTAGFTGQEIQKKLTFLGVRHEFIHMETGFSRINIKMKDFDGTEINGQGPAIPDGAVGALLARLEKLEDGDALVLAGSIPRSIPESIYRDILSRLQDHGILTAVDATGSLLLNVLEYRPFLVKPNQHELGELFHTELRTQEEIVPFAVKLRDMGARNVLVSMGGQGAVLADENGGIHRLPAPNGTLVNAVGAGDSMVAGFLAGWMEQKDYAHAFRTAVASGSASAFSEYLAVRKEVERLLEKMP